MEKKQKTPGIVSSLRYLLFPKRCIACDGILPQEEWDADFCPVCASKWATATRLECPTCGRPDQQCRCLPKFKTSCIIAYVHAVAYERGVVSGVIYGMKRKRKSEAIRFAANLMCTALRDAMKDEPCVYSFFVTSVPPGADAVRSGVDHAAELAKAVAEQMDYPYAPLLVRARRSKKQKSLSATAREQNAQKSYGLMEAAEAMADRKCIILVDDVLTTGATTKTCASLLRKAGAAQVVVLTFAKTHK